MSLKVPKQLKKAKTTIVVGDNSDSADDDVDKKAAKPLNIKKRKKIAY